MGLHQWKKSCAAWTISLAKARFSTSGSRTLPHGGSPRQTLWRSFEAGHSSSGCRSSTASRAHGRARTYSHVESFEVGGSGLVSLGERRFVREVSRRG